VWRDDNEADDLRKAVEDLSWGTVPFPEWKDVLQAMPMDIDAGRNSDGNVVWIEWSGGVDIAKVATMPACTFRRKVFKMMELRSKVLDDLSRERNQLAKVVQVRDLRGLGPSFFVDLLRNRQMMARFRDLATSSVRAYPETLDKVLLLNVPQSFYLFWNVFQSILPEQAKKKFTFLQCPYDAQIVHEVAGCRALLSLTRLISPGLPCPGKGNTRVAGGAFQELALEVPAGTTLSWSWSGGVLDFSAVQFAVDNSLVGKDIVPLARCSTHCGDSSAAVDSVVLLRWSNVFAWRASKTFSWDVSLSGKVT